MLSERGFTGLIPIDELADELVDRISTFRCASDSLENFLTQQAAEQHRDHLSHTSLLFHEDFDGLVGYITLTNDAIGMQMSEVGELGLKYSIDLAFYPAIKICRLAVNDQLQRVGIGGRLLDLAVGEIVAAPSVTAARLLITDAVNDPAVLAFYEKHGFSES